MKKLIETTIQFDYCGKTQKYTVVHNLNLFGLDINAAFITWSARLKKTPRIFDFCEYVVSKGINLVCKPKSVEEIV